MASAGKSAATKALAAAQEAVERKLRPVYDAVDCRNYKLALKSINAVIQARDWQLFCCACAALAAVERRVGG